MAFVTDLEVVVFSSAVTYWLLHVEPVISIENVERVLIAAVSNPAPLMLYVKEGGVA